MGQLSKRTISVNPCWLAVRNRVLQEVQTVDGQYPCVPFKTHKYRMLLQYHIQAAILLQIRVQKCRHRAQEVNLDVSACSYR